MPLTPKTAGSAPGSMNFAFEHKVFATPGCAFRKAADGSGAIVMHVMLGDIVGTVPIGAVCRAFEIEKDSSDDALLKQVGQALKYVREVRPGDSIPSEVIDGSASWMVEERFLTRAKARITLQLVAWLRGGHFTENSSEDFVALAEAPTTRHMVQEAFAALAEKLGYGADQRDEVVDLIDRIARELSYIEALRDRFGKLKRILALFRTLHGQYARARATQEVIERCQVLLQRPAQKVFDLLASVDANTGEILQALKRYDAQIAFIRKSRDALRETYLLWEDQFSAWDEFDGTPGPEAERIIPATYRFAAHHFSLATVWGATAA